MDKDILDTLISLVAMYAIILCIFMTIGYLAIKRGRNFWGWTMIPFLIPFGVARLISQNAEVIFYTSLFLFPTTYVIVLISVLLSGKTKAKRMKEIYEDEQLRESIRSRSNKKDMPNPSGKTINDLYKR